MSIIKNGNLGINRVPFSRMMKSEVAEFAKKTIGIVQNYDAEELLLSPIADQLLDKESEIEMLGVRYGIDPMRERIELLKSEMMLTISSLKLNVKLIAKSKNDEELTLIATYIDTYLRYLDKSKNEKMLHQKISGFLNALESDEALADALEKHNLMSFVDSIKLSKRTVDQAWNKRVKLLSERPRIETKVLVGTVSTAITNLFKAIEVAHLMNPEVDYTALALELSQLSDMYNRSISIRAANNKRKNKKEEEQEEEIEENTDGSTTEATATSYMSFDNEWGYENDAATPIGISNHTEDETGPGDGYDADVSGEENAIAHK